MKEIKVAHYGLNGHAIFRELASAKNARSVAVSGMPEEKFNELKGKPEFGAALSAAKYYADFSSMLEKSGADLVVLCSPRRDEQNTQIGQCLLSGKHVLAEKPIVTNLKALAAVKAAQKKSGKQVRAMLVYAYDPVIRTMRKMVDEGELGDIVQAYGLKSYPFGKRPQDRGVDGGIIQAAIHAVTFIRTATGLDFTEVFAQDTKCGDPNPGELQVGINIAARLSNGGLADILTNYCNPPNFGGHGNDQIRLFGTKAMVEAVDGLKRFSVANGKEPLRQMEIPKTPVAYPLDYIEFLGGGPAPFLTLEESFRDTEIVLQAAESAKKGKPVKI